MDPSMWLTPQQLDECCSFGRVLKSMFEDLEEVWYKTLRRTRSRIISYYVCILVCLSVYIMMAIKYSFYIVCNPSTQNPRKALSSWAKNKSLISNFPWLDRLRGVEVGIKVHYISSILPFTISDLYSIYLTPLHRTLWVVSESMLT